MSATFDCDLFAQYFALPVRDRLEPAPVVTVDEAPHSVSEYYVEDIKELGQVNQSTVRGILGGVCTYKS